MASSEQKRPVVDSIYSRTMVPLAVGMAAGITLGAKVPAFAPMAWVWLILSLAVLGWGLLKGRALRLAPLAVYLSLGFLLIAPAAQTDHPPRHITHFFRTSPWDITGTVEKVTSGPNERIRFVLDRITLSDGGTEQPVIGRVRGLVLDDGLLLQNGALIRFRSRLRPFRNFENPGRFDYRAYQARKGIFASAYTRSNGITLLHSPAEAGLAAAVDRFRSRVIQDIDSRNPPEIAAVLRALLVGDRSGIDRGLRERFNRSGVGHLLAISGLHIGTVAAAAFWLLIHCFRWIPAMTERAWVSRAAALFTIFPVVGYGVLAGGTPSTQRAVIMVLLFLATVWIDKERDLPGFIAAAAVGILVFDPTALFSLSFQLSFAAVTTIVIGLRRWPRNPAKERKPAVRLAARAGQFLAVSILAVLGTLPLVMGAFSEVSLVGPLVNCAAVPLVGFGVLPLGLASVGFSGIVPAAAGWGYMICGKGVAWLLSLLDWISQFPSAAVLVPALSPLESVLYYALLGGVLLPMVAPWRRRFLAVAFVLSLCVATWGIYDRFWHRDLRVTVLDVGQGSASLVEFPGGRVMLVDGGGLSTNRYFDIGARVVGPVLRRKKILSVDTVVLSHANADHMNGLCAIIERFGVGRLWTNGEPSETVSYRQFSRLVADRSIPVTQVDRETPPETIGGVQVSVLHPPAGFLNTTHASFGAGLDDHSIVLKLGYGDGSILLPGDIKAAGERALCEGIVGNRLQSDIIVAPHHGSRYSSSDVFLRAVEPRVAVVSAGWQNRFGFPHPEVLDRYRRTGCRIFRTDQDGAVRIDIDGRHLRIRTEASERSVVLAGTDGSGPGQSSRARSEMSANPAVRSGG